MTDLAAERHRRVLTDWSSIHSRVAFLLSHDAIHADAAPDLASTAASLDHFFTLFTDTSYSPGICGRVDSVARDLWPRFTALIARHNFHALRAPLVGRFESHLRALEQFPAVAPRECSALRVLLAELESASADLPRFIGGISYAIGGLSPFIVRVREGFGREVPGLEALPADFVALSDLIDLMDRVVTLHGFVLRVGVDVSADLVSCLSQLASDVRSRRPVLDADTRKLQATKRRIDAEIAKLAK